MSYVDGFVAAVPVANKADYMTHAKQAAEVFIDHGALRVVENWADDVPAGEVTSFDMAVKRQDDEAVVFSWVEWPSRDARNAGWQAAMKDPRMDSGANPMPFDGKRLIYGGFTTLLDV